MKTMKKMQNEKIIKNKRRLLKNLPADIRRRREILLNISEYVLQNIQPAKLFHGILAKKNILKFRRILLIGIGKAAKGMTDAIQKQLSVKPWKILLADSGHPLPTQKGIENTKKIIAACQRLTKNDLAIVCISGGGSSMLVAPTPGIRLQDKINLTNALLKSGATIQEINIVRKHISEVKGGQLAKFLFPATVWGFVISDVSSNDLSTIASGPIAPDASSFTDALSTLRKYHIKPTAKIFQYLKKGASRQIPETPKPGDPVFKKIKLQIIADHATPLTLALQKTKKIGIKAISLGSKITGEARNAGKRLIEGMRDQGSGMSIFIGSGETTVTCRGKGFGGRNQELVLAALPSIKNNQTVLALATDGVDGMCPERIAGAIGDKNTLERAKKLKLKVPHFLKNNDSYHFFKKTGGRIKTGPTGTNLGDLVMLAVSEKQSRANIRR